MAVKRSKNTIRVSGDDLSNLKLAMKRTLRPAKVKPGEAQCPMCKRVLAIRTKEQEISGTCDPCWDRMFGAPKLADITEPVTYSTPPEDDDEWTPF